ncbi:MAG: TetR/AcrR family transcriptional regulator [Pseudomonadota bacterium]
MKQQRKMIARTDEEKALKRDQILDAAYEMLSRRGYHEATMGKIARKAGVSHGTLYWHFKSKEDLFFAVLEREFLRVDEAIRPALAMDQPAIKKIEMLLRFSVSTLEQSSDFLALMFSAMAGSSERFERSLEEMAKTVYSTYNDMLEQIIIMGKKEGDIREDVNARAVAVAMVSLLDALYLQYGLGTATMDHEKLADGLWDFIENGLVKK